jgi:hypothetical protein
MRLTMRDLVGTVLVIAIGIPYVGWLIDGDMPFVKDPRGMSAVGLVLGAFAYLVMRSGESPRTLRLTEDVAALAVLALGLTSLVLAETAAAEVLLAVFMGSIGVVWALELLDHGGVLHGTGHTAHPTHP